MDGEDQRQAVEPGGRRPDREDGEVFSKVDVYHIGSCGEDRGDDRRLGSVELAKAPDGQPQAYNAGMFSEALEIRRGRRTRGHDRLDDPTTVERPGKLGGVVLHPSYGIEPDAPADQCRGGRLKDRAEPQYPDFLREVPLRLRAPAAVHDISLCPRTQASLPHHRTPTAWLPPQLTGVVSGRCRTSENAVKRKANFGECGFSALERSSFD